MRQSSVRCDLLHLKFGVIQIVKATDLPQLHSQGIEMKGYKIIEIYRFIST